MLLWVLLDTSVLRAGFVSGVNKRRTGTPPRNGCNTLMLRPEMSDR